MDDYEDEYLDHINYLKSIGVSNLIEIKNSLEGQFSLSREDSSEVLKEWKNNRWQTSNEEDKEREI